MRFCLALLLGAAAVAPMAAQTPDKPDDMMSRYEAFKNKAERKYADFRAEANAQYAEFMRKAWAACEMEPPVEAPKDDPIPLIELDKAEIAEIEATNSMAGMDSAQLVRVKDVIRLSPVPAPRPMPISPIVEYPWQDQKSIRFAFFGTPCTVRFDESQRFTLPSVREIGISDMWKRLSSPHYDNTLQDCLKIRDELNLNDWAYILLLKDFVNLAIDGDNERTLMIAYLYAQSGYKMRLYRGGERIGMFYGTDHTIYNKRLMKDPDAEGVFFYRLDEDVKAEVFFPKGMPNEQDMSLRLYSEPNFKQNLGDVKVIESKKFPDMSVRIQVNRNLMDFFETYPSSQLQNEMLSRWALYANTPLNDAVKDSLYPQIEPALADESEYNAVYKLLYLLLDGLQYELDDVVWGDDRAFFAEETLFYPYQDCEDRAILFTRLVRDLVGIDAALVYVPGHLAAAVAFTEDVPGQHIMINGRKFTLCDPTCIGSRPGYVKNLGEAKAILLN